MLFHEMVSWNVKDEERETLHFLDQRGREQAES
jgi:hypothetical protein